MLRISAILLPIRPDRNAQNVVANWKYIKNDVSILLFEDLLNLGKLIG